MSRHRAHVELTCPPGQTARETVDWIQRWFSYYHPNLKATCKLVEEMHGGKLDEHLIQSKVAEILPVSEVSDLL